MQIMNKIKSIFMRGKKLSKRVKLGVLAGVVLSLGLATAWIATPEQERKYLFAMYLGTKFADDYANFTWYKVRPCRIALDDSLSELIDAQAEMVKRGSRDAIDHLLSLVVPNMGLMCFNPNVREKLNNSYVFQLLEENYYPNYINGQYKANQWIAKDADYWIKIRWLDFYFSRFEFYSELNRTFKMMGGESNREEERRVYIELILDLIQDTILTCQQSKDSHCLDNLYDYFFRNHQIDMPEELLTHYENDKKYLCKNSIVKMKKGEDRESLETLKRLSLENDECAVSFLLREANSKPEIIDFKDLERLWGRSIEDILTSEAYKIPLVKYHILTWRGRADKQWLLKLLEKGKTDLDALNWSNSSTERRKYYLYLESADLYFDVEQYDKAKQKYEEIFARDNPKEYGELAENGIKSAFKLGEIYAKGLGVRQDFIKAKEYYGIACDYKFEGACEKYREVNEKSR